MKPSKRSQPYRKGTGRAQNSTLMAMMRGRTSYGHNPQDLKRASAKKKRRKRRPRRRLY